MQTLPRGHLVHVDRGYEKGGPGHCAVENLTKNSFQFGKMRLFKNESILLETEFYLVSEHPVLTGEGETLDDSSCEILESFGSEPAMKSLIAAV